MADTKRFSGKVVIITGGSRGIGKDCTKVFGKYFCLMVFNATFNNISVISWWSVLLVEKTEGPEENHPSVYESVHYISAN